LFVVLATQAFGQASGSLDKGLEAFRKRDFHSAELAFIQATSEQPLNAHAWKLLGSVYIAREQFSKAEPPLSRACVLSPHEENACYYLGRVYYILGRLEEAQQAFEAALKSAPDRGRPLHGLALVREGMGDPSGAEEFYKQAIRVHERAALVDYGKFLFKLGRFKESLEVLGKANATAELDRVTRALASLPAARAQRSVAPVRFEPTEMPMIVKNGAVGEKHQIETMIAGIGILDYDNDGWPDIYVANGAIIPSLQKRDASFLNRLFRNNRDGTFSDVTTAAGVGGEGYSVGVAVADYDNDGCVDLFVTGVRSNTLYHSRCNGSFEDVTARAGLAGNGGWTVAAGWFDYDNDGLLDLFVVRYVDWDPSQEPYCGVDKPGYRTYCHPSQYRPLANALYHNQGDGTFRDVSGESGIAAHPGKGMGVAFGDYDLDGHLDVFVANDTVPNFLFHNEGNGTFREVALEASVAYNDDGRALSSMGADFRDYDNDGREDLLITALSNETFPLFRNLGGGKFINLTAPTGIAAASLPLSGWSAGLFDLNNDGFKDAFVAAGHVMDNAELVSSRSSRQPNLIFLNQGDGTFRSQLLPGEALHRGAAFADFDRDGRVDVVVTRLNESPLLLRNVTTRSGNWITLRLVGRRSNRDGIGARVHIVTAAGEQWNRVTTAVGYGCSSDRTVHFGLGNESQLKSLEIEWPSGSKQRLENLNANQFKEIHEP
jgi:tetratricopeptide (TPR) repeat protein